MVKYANRGLIVQGSLSPLFETLYFVVCVTLFSVFSVFTLYKYLSLDPNPKSKYHLMCINQSADSDFETMKSMTLFLALSFPFFVIFISMFCYMLHYLRSRGKNNTIVKLRSRSRSQVRSRSGPRSGPKGPRTKDPRPGPGLTLNLVYHPPTHPPIKLFFGR